MKRISEFFGMLFDFNNRTHIKEENIPKRNNPLFWKKDRPEIKEFSLYPLWCSRQPINHRNRTQYKIRYHRGNYLNPEYPKKTGRHTGTIITTQISRNESLYQVYHSGVREIPVSPQWHPVWWDLYSPEEPLNVEYGNKEGLPRYAWTGLVSWMSWIHRLAITRTSDQRTTGK